MITDGNWPLWGPLLLWSAGTMVLSWGVGWLIATIANTQAARRLPERQRDWATIIQLVSGRVPFWSLLVGVWLAAGFWPLTPEARLLVGRAIFVLLAFSMTFRAARVASHLVDRFGSTLAPALPVSSLTRNIAWGLTALLGVLVILNGLGLSIAPMLTALGVGGLAVALALQEPLANFFAGVFITLGGQVRLGDYVKLDTGQEGYVADFSWRSTRLRMLANNLVVVPNAKLAQAILVNHHLPARDLAVLVEVGVDYASDLSHVEAVVGRVGRSVMLDVTGGVRDFEPFVRFHTFGDSSINFTVILRAQEFVDQYLVKHEFIKRLHAAFEHEGIVIPFPIRTLIHRMPPGEAGQTNTDPAGARRRRPANPLPGPGPTSPIPGPGPTNPNPGPGPTIPPQPPV